MVTTRRLKKIQQVLRNRQLDLTVVCENIHDPHNVSAILRTCDAVGIAKVHLLYPEHQFPQLGKKSSASAKKWVETQAHTDARSLREYLKKAGFTIFATHLSERATSLYELDWTRPAAIIVGNEHEGVSEEALSIADQTVYIPMFGMVESLNVSVATAVILYEAARQRLQRNRYPHPGIPADWLENKIAEWKKK